MKQLGWLCLAACACVGSSAPIETETAALTGETQQGIYILGKFADGMFNAGAGEHAHVLAQPTDPGHSAATFSVSSAGTYLTTGTHEKTDPWFQNAILRDVRGKFQLRVDAGSYVRGNIVRYRLSRQALGPGGMASGTWTDYCDGVGALPLQGWYDGRRIHHLDTSITFACDKEGVADKCDDWGYPAGNAGPAPAMQPTPWNLHQTCTNMAGATYCMDGKSHTRELTPIEFGDITATPFSMPVYPLPAPLPGDLDAFAFEAGWTPKGPVCLSKLRWRSLPPDPCDPAVLPDPRTEQGRGRGGQFCDDIGYAGVRAASLMINGSLTMDAPEYVWQSGSDTVMSLRGYYAPASNLPPPHREVIAPFLGYGIAAPFIDHMILRNLPGSLDPATDMFQLFIWVGPGGDRVVARSAPPGYVPLGGAGPLFEGYSFRTSRLGLAPLRMCSTPNGYITTIAATCPGGGAGAPQGFALLPP